MKEIHLIQRDPQLKPWPTEKGPPEYESGFWDLTSTRAAAAIGAEIYFHSKQTDPSFFGGTITGFRIKAEEPWKGRVIFSLIADAKFKGKRTGRDRWAVEMKIVE